jgi:hypothetical protein
MAPTSKHGYKNSLLDQLLKPSLAKISRLSWPTLAMVRGEATLAERDAALLPANARIRELEQALAVSEASRRNLEADVTRLGCEYPDKDSTDLVPRQLSVSKLV